MYENRKTGLARASIYVYSVLLVVFIALQAYFEVQRVHFWEDHLSIDDNVAKLYHNQIQVDYFTWTGTVVGLMILWSIAVSVSKRRQKQKREPEAE